MNARASVTSLDDLAGLGPDELRALYLAGRAFDLRELDGALVGRALAVVGLGNGRRAGLVRRLARSSRFPWRGKSFAADGPETGTGSNRLRIGPVRAERYRFTTGLDASAVDGADCVLLDYDHPDNPWFIRRIRDELREVAPGLYLGPAMWDGDEPRVVFWFAVAS